MRKVIAIISEYNPFHTGHKHQIDSIRKELGEDSVIIAIMSGNYTQRAECAIADKLVRATAAVECGVNLVLELPFPYSSASAELFARAGVNIADSLGVVDYLSFGSELGSIDKLIAIANNISSERFTVSLGDAIKKQKHTADGYPALFEAVYRDTFACDEAEIYTPNNILAIEYIKALGSIRSNIQPHTIARKGADFNTNVIKDNEHPSATAIRARLEKNDISALDFLPIYSKEVYLDAYNKNDFPCDFTKLGTSFISFFRINNTPTKQIHDAEGGLYNRLARLSHKAGDINTLTELALTKKYTRARIRRAILFSYFGVTSSDVKSEPRYSQVLAMDSLGAEMLKAIKKKGKIKLITKPSATDGLDGDALMQKHLCDTADSVFQLAKPRFTDGSYHLTFTPYVKK